MSAYIDKIKELGGGSEVQIYANSFVSGEWVNEAKAAHNLTIVGAVENTSGGPGDSLTHYLALDGTDDVAHTADHADLRYTGIPLMTMGGFFWIPASSNSDAHAVLFGKGGSAYEFRQNSTTPTTIRAHPDASLGIQVTGQPTGEWIFYVWNANGSTISSLRRRLASDTNIQSLDTTGTSFTEAGNTWKFGARGNPGTFERFWHGRVAGFFHIRGVNLSDTQLDEIYDSAFEPAIGPHVFFDLTDLPGDFGNADTAEIVVRTRGVDIGATPLKLFAQLFQSDETTTLSDEVEVAEEATDSSFTNSAPIVFTGLNTTADKTVWDGARVRFRWGT